MLKNLDVHSLVNGDVLSPLCFSLEVVLLCP